MLQTILNKSNLLLYNWLCSLPYLFFFMCMFLCLLGLYYMIHDKTYCVGVLKATQSFCSNIYYVMFFIIMCYIPLCIRCYTVVSNFKA